MSRNIVRVLPKDKEWKITFNSAERAVYGIKATAIMKAKELAKNNIPSQLVIHKTDGKIETEHTYGNDPYPPVG